MNFWDNIRFSRLLDQEVSITWLGQAGFVIKDSRGLLLAIDPYLSNCVERIHGFKRIMPNCINIDEFKPDILICTHHHLDHFDIDAIPNIMTASKTELLGPETVINNCKDIGIDIKRLTSFEEGKTLRINDIEITSVFADHGELAPDAIGVLVNISGFKIYYAGDTGYRPEKMKNVIDFKPDIAILPINGEYGNLGPKEAALLARDINVKKVIPCHYWMFKEHRGDPLAFEEELAKIDSQCKLVLFSEYESKIFTKDM